MKKIVSVLLILLLMTGCTEKTDPIINDSIPEKIPLSNVLIEEDELYLLDVEGDYSLTYSLFPEEYEASSIEWIVTDPDILSCEDGVIHILAEGNTSVILNVDGICDFVKIKARHSDYLAEPIEKRVEGCTYYEGLLVANKTYSLPKDYDPGKILDPVQKAFDDMVKAAKKDGVSLYICSGYRSYSKQKSIYNRYVEKNGRADADTYSARPGHSEHQTGLSMDINTIDYSFHKTKEGKWLIAHAEDYGFIMRYPEGKQSITGYKFEPWHYRYVGTKWAKMINESGLCMEEYFGFDSEYK